MDIIELLERKQDVLGSEIPKEWEKSFLQFMMGQTCTMKNGEFLYYYEDFKWWFYENEKQIRRLHKIEKLNKDEKRND